MSAFFYLFAMDFGQTVNVVVRWCGNSEILCHIDDFHIVGNVVLIQERPTFAVSEAEEHHVNLVERHFGGKPKVGFAHKAFVHIAHKVSRVRFAISEYNLGLGVINQQSNQLAACISSSAQNSYLYHNLFVRHYKCKNQVEQQAAAAKHGQQYPNDAHYRRVKVEILGQPAAYTANGAVLL